MTDAIQRLTPRSIGGLPIIKAAERPPFINMMIFGESGIGKTRLAGSADAVPEMRKVLCIDIEGGGLTLANSYPNVDIVRVKKWDEMQDVYDQLHADLDSGRCEYQTAVVDSLTEAQKLNMEKTMFDQLEAGGNVHLDVPSMREWGINLNQIRRFVRAFRDLEMNVIFTALVKADQNKRTGVTTKKPSLSGKMADEIAAFLDVVVYLYRKEVDGEQRRLLCSESTDEVIAKDRTNKLEAVLIEPTMNDIYAYINGSKTRTDKDAN